MGDKGLTGGASGDRWGAKRVYLAGLLVFTMASALCGVAPNVEVLTGARVLQGLGAAMLVPCSLRLINQAFPDPNGRAVAIGYWAGFGGVAMAAGPLAGGILVALFGWRSIFLANVPIGLVGAWLTWRVGRDERSASGGHLDVSGQFTANFLLFQNLKQGQKQNALLSTILAEGVDRNFTPAARLPIPNVN